MGRRQKNRVGYKVPGGRLTITKYMGKNPKGKATWECVCSCKEEDPNRVVATWDLIRNGKKSCGCMKRGGDRGGRSNAFLLSPNRPEAVGLWRSGWSLRQISRRVGVTKQRVHQYVREYLSTLGEAERVEAEAAHRAGSHGRDPLEARGKKGDGRE